LLHEEEGSMNPRPQRVLVVDDEPVIANTIAEILKMNGINALGFTRPLEALANASADTPTLVVSDVLMPVMSGFELARRLKVVCPESKVLLLSGHVQILDCLEEEPNYEFPVLPKPIRPELLLLAIRAQL
jgi:DNA-binding NtrC family response regulator